MTNQATVNIAAEIKALLDANATLILEGAQSVYGLPTETLVISKSKAYGVCPSSKSEVELTLDNGTYHLNQESHKFLIWAYAKPIPPTTPELAQRAVCDLMDKIEVCLRANRTASGYVENLQLSETNYDYEEVQPGTYGATASILVTTIKTVTASST
jgi:hypothetical protein